MKIKDLNLGDIIFTYKRGNIIAQCQSYFSSKKSDIKVSHSAIYLGAGGHLIYEYSFFGSRIIPIEKYLDNNHDIFVTRIKGLTQEKAEKLKSLIYDDFKLFNGYAYKDYLGFILAKFLRWNKKKDNPFIDANKRVCSSVVDYLYKKIGYDLAPELGTGYVSPTDLTTSILLKFIGVFKC